MTREGISVSRFGSGIMSPEKGPYELAKYSNTPKTTLRAEARFALWHPIRQLAEIKESFRALSGLKKLDDFD